MAKGEFDLNNNENKKMVFEDITSSSHKPPVAEIVQKTGKAAKKAAKVAKKVADDYGNTTFKNIDKVIKIIAFVVAAAFFLLFLVGAVILYLLNKSFIFLCALVLLFGAAVSMIFLYLIYGIGHIISQNNEILKRIDD